MAYAPTFQQAIEIVESLPQMQQDELIDLIRRRRIEQRRTELAHNIATARSEFGRGEIVHGSVDDLFSEFSGAQTGLE